MRKLVISVYADDPVPFKRISTEKYPLTFVDELSTAVDFSMGNEKDDYDIPI